MLLPNELFVLWGYMTAVPGSYEVQKDGIILFKPKKEPLFVVYGQRNDSIGKDKVRIRFANFQHGKNYIRFENGKTYSVFNDNPNCLSSRYIHTFPRKEMGNSFSLIADFKRLEFAPFLGEGHSHSETKMALGATLSCFGSVILPCVLTCKYSLTSSSSKGFLLLRKSLRKLMKSLFLSFMQRT